jgi:hypothetical protein
MTYFTHHANGSATLMRGKSRTCRDLAPLVEPVFDRARTEDLMKAEGFATGKSQTGRASDSQSHCNGRIEVRREAHAESVMSLP